jgi:FtsP/CotA-like multicopper oxidase with cupredoxin domain
MRKLLFLLASVVFAGAALGQPTIVPPCNAFDATGTIPMYVSGATSTTNCTDYFGVGNWANSPLPAGTISGFTLVSGGSGYATPLVVVDDPTNPTGTCASTGTLLGNVVIGFAAPTGNCAGYTLPQVTIVDVGAGGTLAVPTCGGAGQPACGSGAMATAVIGPPFTGGMLKFQDPLADLKAHLATSDAAKFAGSDYYEIALVQYAQKMHASLPPSTLRGYVQVPSGSSTAAACAAARSAALSGGVSYLGPSILAVKDRPVRVKFTNCLDTGAAGNLFIPADTTYMGAGKNALGFDYTENRATLHLHGGATPWISDGTPHQWTVPVGETADASVQKGVSVAYVPDMWFDATGALIASCAGQPSCAAAGATNNPGPGSLTFFWTNQQGARLMFYHDHAYGITRLNVYAGEAAGYVLVDPVEENALAAATAPGTVGTTPDLAHLIPIVIQDKTFVPGAAQLGGQDPTWAGNFGKNAPSALGSNGDLWFPHVYTPNQNPADPGLASGFGHWDYGPWFFPPQTTLSAANPPTAVTVPCTSAAFPGQVLQPSTACPTCGCPIIPNVSGTPEGFMDTPLVNGVAYPVLHVAPAAYRFKILSAGNDRSLNLSWFVADATQGGTEVAMLPAVPPMSGTALPLCSAVNPVAVPQLGLGLVTALLDNSGNPFNGTGLQQNCWPNYGPLQGIPAPQTMWAADGRAGGAPDPRKAGPPWIQIGSEGGLLPSPVVIPATPVNYEQNTRSITIGSVAMHGLWLGPAERADVIVDFSQAPALCAAQVPPVSPCTLILYNDAPAPAPAIDSRLDYFTNDGDQSPIGGAPNTPPGYGPNTRTIMQVIVDQSAPNAVPFSLPALKAAFASTATSSGLFATTQPTIIVPESAYNTAYNRSDTNHYMGISDNTLTFAPIAPLNTKPCVPAAPGCVDLEQKAIQELFTLDYGRMNATLGVELPLTTFQNQTTIPLGYVDWPTEIIKQGDTQLWKVTHNGVDSHFIHFHLFNVQVINRVGWDGSLRQIDQNEAGWKDTVRMNPLEDILVALQPITPSLPFPLADSIRSNDVTMPDGAPDANISGLDPSTGNATVTTVNNPVNFGWEYVWHCHILGHEENDMMRAIIFQVPPPAPSNLMASKAGSAVTLTWQDNSASETSFIVQRALATDTGFSTPTTILGIAPSAPNTAFGGTLTYADTVDATKDYLYRIQAEDDFNPLNANPVPFQQSKLQSGWSNVASTLRLVPTVTFTGAPASATYNTSLVVTATTTAVDSAGAGITGTAGVCTVSSVLTTATASLVTTTASVHMDTGTGACNLTAAWPQTATYTAATAAQTTLASLAAPTVTFTGAPASASYNSTFPVTATTNANVLPTISGTAGVCSVGAVSGSPASATATVTMISGTGTCTLSASWTADVNYSANSMTQTTTAAKLGSTTSMTSSPNPSVAGQAVTVNFSVASNPSMTAALSGPAGSVTVTAVLSGQTNQTCTGALTSATGPGAATGTGSCALTLPAAGAWSVSAAYGGNANFGSSSSSPAVTQQVRDFSIVFKAPTSQSVNGNQKATYTVTVSSLNNFAGTVNLTCGGSYPASYSCSVAPASLTLSAGGSGNVTVTVSTAKGSPGTYNVTTTGKSGSGVPATGGLTHTANATLTTKS